MTQYYEAEVVSEYVIRGNAAILKCTIPSFVAEFVSVDSWVGSDGSTFKPSNDYGIAFFARPCPFSSRPSVRSSAPSVPREMTFYRAAPFPCETR